MDDWRKTDFEVDEDEANVGHEGYVVQWSKTNNAERRSKPRRLL